MFTIGETRYGDEIMKQQQLCPIPDCYRYADSKSSLKLCYKHTDMVNCQVYALNNLIRPTSAPQPGSDLVVARSGNVDKVVAELRGKK